MLRISPCRSSMAIAVCTACIAFAIATPASAEECQAAAATINLGARSGCSHPTKHGHAYTGGGDISVTQPTPDSLVVRMHGAVAACGNPFCDACSVMEFVHDLDFHVDVTPMGCPAKLLIESHAYGLLRGRGKTGVAEMTDAVAMLSAGSNEIVSLGLPPSCITGCEALAPITSRGPICVPICSGCYHLRQQFKIRRIRLSASAVARVALTSRRVFYLTRGSVAKIRSAAWIRRTSDTS